MLESMKLTKDNYKMKKKRLNQLLEPIKNLGPDQVQCGLLVLMSLSLITWLVGFSWQPAKLIWFLWY